VGIVTQKIDEAYNLSGFHAPIIRTYSPATPGPLKEDVANTFTGGTYTEATLTEDTTFILPVKNSTMAITIPLAIETAFPKQTKTPPLCE
jgi:hypothetical protein